MVRMRRMCLVGVPALVLLATACQREAADEARGVDASADAAAAPDSMAGMPGMGGMAGMGGMQMGSDMMAHMQTMEARHGDSLMQMVPQHRQMLGNTMAQMDREMQAMNMGADSQWSALTDSLRSDLTRMPQMSAVEMEEFMAGHRGRVTRLMEMHGSMMGGTGR